MFLYGGVIFHHTVLLDKISVRRSEVSVALKCPLMNVQLYFIFRFPYEDNQTFIQLESKVNYPCFLPSERSVAMTAIGLV